MYQTPPHQKFIQLEPDNGEPATEPTDVWVGFDNKNLYIGARLHDSQPDSITGYMSRRDKETGSDVFEAAIDSYFDHRSGFYFIVNPVGAIQDGVFYNDTNSDDSWDGVWDWKTTIDHKGWSVEMRIPFSQLRFTTKSDEILMGIGFGRQLQRNKEHSLDFYIPRSENGLISHMGTLYGLKDIDPPKRIEWLPYVTGTSGDLPSLNGNPFYNGHESTTGIGSDLKVGIGNNLTVDATINPDFGQVEVDPASINLSAYETLYEEKRPFFVEGSSIFQFGSGGPTSRYGFNSWKPDFFYSRRIGGPPTRPVSGDSVKNPTNTRILGAAKLSGKLPGQWSIGALTAVTKREFGWSMNPDGSKSKSEIEPLTAYNLVRTQKEYNEGKQGLGLLGTWVTRSFDNPSLKSELNEQGMTGGVDGWTFFGKDRGWATSGWLGFSTINGQRDRITDIQQNYGHYFQRPDATHISVDTTKTSLTGFAGNWDINREKGHWTINARTGFTTPEYDSNDLGVTSQTDRIYEHTLFGYKWYDPGKIFRYANINFTHSTNHNFEGKKINEMYNFFGYLQLLNYWGFSWFSGWGPRTLSDTQLRGGPMVESPEGMFGKISIDSDSRQNITGGIYGSASNSDYGSHGGHIGGYVGWKVGTNLNINMSITRSKNKDLAQYIGSFEDSTATAMYGKHYIVSQLNYRQLSSDIRIEYTFTPTLSFQAYFQPFFAVGAYSHYKEFTHPESYDFMEYGVDGNSTIVTTSDSVFLDPTGDYDKDPIRFTKPDFNSKSFIGNAVLRWEFRPGSVLYLVWTSHRYDSQNPGVMKINRDIKHLFDQSSDDVVAIKVTYWFGE